MDQIFGTPIDLEQSSPEAEEIFGTDTEGQGDSGIDLDNDPANTGQSNVEPSNNKKEKLLGKFNDVDALADAYINLVENKLGKEPEQFDSVEQLSEAYKQAEKELGSRGKKKADNSSQSQQQVTPQNQDEMQRLLQINQQQQAQLQQAQQYFQMLQMQAQQQQQQQQQSNINQGQSAVKQEPVDPQKLLDDFYENPADVIQKLVKPLVDQKTGEVQQQYQQQYQQLMKQYVEPMQVEVAKRNLIETWDRQINDLKKNIPDFSDYEQDIMPEIQKDRNLSQLLNTNPSAMQIVVRTAYDRAKVNRLQQASFQAQQQSQQQQNLNQKKGARITSGGAKRVLRQPSDEERELAEIFGMTNKKQGIFG